MKISKRMFRIVCFALALLFLLSGCTSQDVQKSAIGQRTQVGAEYTDAKYHTADPANLVYVAKSGLIELYFDSTTYGIAIKETNTGKVWQTLPQSASAENSAQTAVLTATVSDGSTEYILNSQDNAVAFETASFQPTENGIQVTYDMAPDKETADCAFDAVPAGALYLSVTVSYTLEDGALRAKINCGNILLSNGYTLETLTLLDCFGATDTAAEGDYIFVPDGCGATQATVSALQDDYECRIFVPYGDDPALGEQAQTDENGTVLRTAALIPAYGIKSGNAAFLALVESGDAICEIRSYACKGAGTYNRVGPTFQITQTVLSGAEGKQTLYTGIAFTGELSVCYRFLTDKNASYSGMASACRELLIRNGTLSTKTVTPTGYLPFVLTVQAAVAKNNGHGEKVLTDYSQLLELLKLMKAKSINNIFVRYNGVLDGADAQGKLQETAPIHALGSRKNFDALTQYAKTQQFTLYLNTDIISRRKKNDDGKEAGNLFGKSIVYTEQNPFAEITGQQTHTRSLLALSQLDKNVNEFVNSVDDYAFGGYCIDDAGSVLYSDYRAGAQSRVHTVNLLSAQATTLSAGHKLMVDTGNMYMLKNADVVANLPSTTAYPESDTYSAVPFVQMVLHGIVEYAHTPQNLASDTDAAFLKAMEYGALPSYFWIFENTKSDAVNALYNYENQITAAAEQYTKANALLSDLQDARMTAHEKVQDGVYRTEYNNSIVIYFNYNTEAVTVNAFTIAPMSFLRVN
ncbi:MAG: DUF5696 domain-containing protein [Candidatus Fimenecus sp.]